MPGHKSCEYARYSPPCFSIFVFLYTIAAIRRWSLGVQEQKIPGACFIVETPPMARSSLEVPRHEASPFQSLSSVFASLLKAYLVFCCLYSDTFASANFCVARDVVFEPSWPLACNIKLVFILFIELCCDYLPVGPRPESGAPHPICCKWYESASKHVTMSPKEAWSKQK